jgi:DNA-binding response OmpR family regulator
MGEENAKPGALVVEDDEQIAYLVGYILEQEGYEVHRAATVAAAADLIGTLRAPAVATLDISLPDGTGVDLIIRIKSTPGWERVPILMVTAKPKEQDVNWAIKSGAKAYIVKPFKPEALRDTVRRIVKKTA